MVTSLTIIRYRRALIPFAVLGMAIHRLPLALNGKISFYKLMGSGRNGTFDKQPDLQQWAILSVRESAGFMHAPSEKQLFEQLYGSFISGWTKFFRCETSTLLLQAIEGHGTWDDKKVFGELPSKSDYEGPLAILTRATLRFSKLRAFWENVPPVAAMMNTAPGFILSYGIGEIPWIKQATFSVWQSKNDMKAFAYGMKQHAEVIQKTRQQKWYSEDMFTRFKILHTSGTVRGKKPLEGML
jgi:hypothetical protein